MTAPLASQRYLDIARAAVAARKERVPPCEESEESEESPRPTPLSSLSSLSSQPQHREIAPPRGRPDWLAGHCVGHGRLLSGPEYDAAQCSWCPPDAPLPATVGLPLSGYGLDTDGLPMRYSRCTACGGHLQGSRERTGVCLRCDSPF